MLKAAVAPLLLGILWCQNALGRPGNTFTPWHATQSHKSDIAILHTLAGSKVRVSRQETCDMEDWLRFLGGLPGNCDEEFTDIDGATGSLEELTETLDSFCVNCAADFVVYLRDTCDDEDSVDFGLEQCSRGPDGTRCGVWRFREDSLELLFNNNCDIDSGRCSRQCERTLQNLTETLGCCLAQFEEVEDAWDACDVDFPEGCVEDQDDDDDDLSDAVLGVVIALPIVVFVGVGAFVLGCVLFCCCCRR